MIPEHILLKYKAKLITFEKGEVVVEEGNSASHYFQVFSGEVKMFNLTEDGKEFVQSIFGEGKSFGEPPLFNDLKYPASAKAHMKSEVYRLAKRDFFQCLQDHPNIHLNFTKTLSDRLYYKATILKEVSVYPPEHRVITFLKYVKKRDGFTGTTPYVVQLTRQEIGELIGLRTETVIRVIKKLEKEGSLAVKDRKVIL